MDPQTEITPTNTYDVITYQPPPLGSSSYMTEAVETINMSLDLGLLMDLVSSSSTNSEYTKPIVGITSDYTHGLIGSLKLIPTKMFSDTILDFYYVSGSSGSVSKINVPFSNAEAQTLKDNVIGNSVQTFSKDFVDSESKSFFSSMFNLDSNYDLGFSLSVVGTNLVVGKKKCDTPLCGDMDEKII